MAARQRNSAADTQRSATEAAEDSEPAAPTRTREEVDVQRGAHEDDAQVRVRRQQVADLEGEGSG